MHKSLPFYNWFQCIVQPVQLAITGNPFSTVGLTVLAVWLAVYLNYLCSSGCKFCRTSVSGPATSISNSLVLSADPTAAPSTQASSWDTAPPQTGDQGYVSPLIDLYLEQNSDLEALYEDSPADQELVSYEDVSDAPSGSEADPAICSENQSYWETVPAVTSYMKWSFHPELEYVCPCQDNLWTGSRSHPTGKVLVAMPADNWFCYK